MHIHQREQLTIRVALGENQIIYNKTPQRFKEYMSATIWTGTCYIFIASMYIGSFLVTRPLKLLSYSHHTALHTALVHGKAEGLWHESSSYFLTPGSKFCCVMLGMSPNLSLKSLMIRMKSASCGNCENK